MRQFDDLSGQQFGPIYVNSFSHMRQNGQNKKHGMSYYNCTCKECGTRLVLARANILQYVNRHKHYGHRSIRS